MITEKAHASTATRTLEGTWRFHQSWGESSAYSFDAEFSADGTISINNGMFFGTYSILGPSTQISLAIAHFKDAPPIPKSITAYVGNVTETGMGGMMTGSPEDGGKVSEGIWSAHLVQTLDESKGYHVPA